MMPDFDLMFIVKLAIACWIGAGLAAVVMPGRVLPSRPLTREDVLDLEENLRRKP